MGWNEGDMIVETWRMLVFLRVASDFRVVSCMRTKACCVRQPRMACGNV